MYYVLFVTERCNLTCSYCEPIGVRNRMRQDLSYSVDDLAKFLGADDFLFLQLYGGEPLLRIDLIRDLLSRVQVPHVSLQTNGWLLDRLPDDLFEKIHVVSVSLDGGPDVTDRMRGDGVYERAVRGAKALRERGYRGSIDARMTVSPGVSIKSAVHHLAEESEVTFDRIHWQLNVQFRPGAQRHEVKFVERWLERSYNQEITELIDWWVDELEQGRFVKLVPFAQLTHDLITGAKVDHLRCGAGQVMWSIATDGQIYPCPVMRTRPSAAVGNIRTLQPEELFAKKVSLAAPCPTCEVFDKCGGRCLVANHAKSWGESGFALTCDTVKHLLRELERIVPRVRPLLESGATDLGVPGISMDYEVIP